MADPTDALINDAIEKIQSTASRSITTKLVPFLTLVLVPVAAWIQEQIGIDLSSTDLAVFIGSAVLGISGVAGTYIRGRLRGVYQLHSDLINNGIEAYKSGNEEIKKGLNK